MYALVLLHKSACLGLGKAQILMKHKKFFPIHPSIFPLEEWGSFFKHANPTNEETHRPNRQRLRFWFEQDADLSKNAKKYFTTHPKSSFESMRSIFLCYLICCIPSSVNVQTYRHYNQKPVSQSRQSADFSKNAKNIFLNPLKSPLEEWGVFFRQPKCRVNHSLSA